MSNGFLTAMAKAEAYPRSSKMKMEKPNRPTNYRDPVDLLVEEFGLYTESLEDEGYEYKDIVAAMEKVINGLRKAYENQQ